MKEEIIVEKPQLDDKEESDEHSKSILFWKFKEGMNHIPYLVTH